ncbi:TonB-dependent receptor [Novosphingobium flavum]|uniref:TonB-dependent receptor n=1 Tax=Novosphingobium flavum TaxID=1778672 RepID=A0A7X1KLZ7_9SPHN|nr:TonB-dependent receptor [Novosphingobium flavum]MBC2666104.1 TonB-dependent receptor [Novosphingobium flavum]
MKRLLAVTLLASASIIAVDPALAQDKAADAENTADIIVTGSRVITNGNESPTPVTTLTTDALQASKPTTVYQALLEQPLIAGAKGGKLAGSTGQGGNNNSISSLNLRGLGGVRGLVLFDGKRVAPQNLNGEVDLAQIPQMLLQRVDLQTGGSSAVYGSDAIAGAVNFITNRKFNGIRFDGSFGVSTYGDYATYDFGAAYGHDLFEGRGHFEASVQYRNDPGLLRTDRDYIQEFGKTPWQLLGNGTSVPYFYSNIGFNNQATYGGRINRVSGPSSVFLNGVDIYKLDFRQNGVATQFVNGTLVTGSTELGGNGGQQTEIVSLGAKDNFLQTFGRFDYDLTDDVHFYLTGYWNRENQFNYLSNTRLYNAGATSGSTGGVLLTTQNAFLPDDIRAALQGAGVTTFRLGKIFTGANVDPMNTSYVNDNINVSTGLEGKLGTFNWDIGYSHSFNKQKNVSNNTFNTSRLLAALDSVLVNGTPTCRVLTQPQFAAQYAGCIPLNPFGPTATTKAQWDYIRQPTTYIGRTTQDSVSGGISGSPFETWAGPLNVALSGEWRRLGYSLYSEAEVANVTALDCAGLGIPNTTTSCVNGGTTSIWPNGSASRPPVSQRVVEGAIEADVPVLKDVPLAQDVRFNLAARHARYTSTGNVVITDPNVTRKFNATTWKVGLNWQVSDAIKIRATRSRDFRAPNLSELFLPGRTQALTGTTDYLTGAISGQSPAPNAPIVTMSQTIGGNPNVKPEVGYTTTVGVVLTPSPAFSLAIDYYNIKIKNAITTVDGSQVDIQQSCYASGGASPYCSLQERPLGFANKDPLTNAATKFYTATPLNIGELRTHGVDVEANFRTELGGQPLSIRALATYQPHLRSIQPGTKDTDAAGVSIPKLRIQASIRYNLTDTFRIDWTTRWRSHLLNVDPLLGLNVKDGYNYVKAVSYSNLNLSWKVTPAFETYLNVQNVFNQRPPVYTPLASGSPFASGAGVGGVGYYPADDAIGRYFIVGFRSKF